MKFSFVILHYLTQNDTEECINSILSMKSEASFNIVVVDNASTNDSGMRLQEKYKNIKQVHFIKNETNLGFAKGNNVGYIFSKKILKVDFIILLNNDTIIKQQNFIMEIIRKFKENRFHILGPDIISTVDGLHQNPQRSQELNPKEIRKMIFVLNIYKIFNIFNAEWILDKYRGVGNSIKENGWERERVNVQLHGSCLIFSPDYVRNYKGLYDNTYMYMEEHILFYIAKKENLKVLYSPDLKIFHKEDSSTNALYKKAKKKRAFLYKNLIRSSKELLKIKENNQLYRENIIDN